MRTLQLILAACFTLGVVSVAPPAAANPPAVCSTLCGDVNSDDGVIQTVVFGSGEGGSGQAISNPPAWLAACTWEAAAEGSPIPAELAGGDVGGTGVWVSDTWIVRCPTESAIALGLPILGPSGIISVFPDGDVPPRIIDAVIQEAVDQAPLTAFYPSSAPAGTPDAPFITQISTYLWVDDDQWQPVTATSTIPPLSVTATATPVGTVWSGGDAPDKGIPCGQGFPPRTQQDFADNDFACQMTYKHSSAVGEHQLTVAVLWEVTYVCSAVCGSGTADPQTITSTRIVTVAELQAIATG